MEPQGLERKIKWFREKPLYRGVLIILGIVIFIVGIVVSSFLSEKSKFAARSAEFKSHISNLTIEAYGVGSSSMLLALTITNSGSKVIIPAKFKLFIKNKWRWISLKETLITEYPKNYKKIENPIDLQTFAGKLEADKPVVGFLKFIAEGVSEEQLKKIIETRPQIKLICIDSLNQKEYRSFPPLKKEFKKIIRPSAYPRHNLEVIP